MFKGILPGLFVLFFGSGVFAQPGKTINVYADSEKGDSIYTAVELFFNELNKSVKINFSIRPPAQFNNEGILIIKRSQADKSKNSYSSLLKALGPEGIQLTADQRSLKVIGNTSLAVQQGFFIYLEQLGYRYLLPGEDWTIIPKLSSIYKPVKIVTQPDYEFRTIANGHGYLNSQKLKSDFDNWYKVNRLGGAFNIWLGHAYDWIVSQRTDEFKQHPEYFAEPVAKGTIPTIFKFNVANKNLVNLVKDIAEKEMKKYADKDYSPKFFSMEPSDGGGYCTTPECKLIGGPSDQAFYLANEVAKVAKKYGVIVGSYAYNEHIVPTKYKLESNLFVMVTNGFNRSQYSTNELLAMWGKKVSRLGVYEYLNVFEGNMDMPGKSTVTRPAYLQKSIREFYSAGARSYQGESTIGWISHGFGQYIVSKLLWNRNLNLDSLKKDFFNKAFEQSAAPMQKLFDTWEKYPFGVPAENDLADWHSWVNEAYSIASNDKVRKRIEDVMVYLHYMVLYADLQKKKTDENMLTILRYVNRTKDEGIFATVPAMVSLANYSGFPQYAYYANPGKQVWMDDNTPVLSREIIENFRSDAKKIKKTEGLLSFGRAGALVNLNVVTKLPATKFSEGLHSFWGNTEYIIHIKKQSVENFLEIKSGFSAGPPKALDVSINIYKQFGENGKTEGATPVLKFEQSKKLENEKFSLTTLKPGFYSVIVEDYAKMFILTFSPSIDYSVLVLPELLPQTTTVGGYNTFYFFVPPSVKKFIVTKVNINLTSPLGREIKMPINTPESVTIEVKPGESGIWKIYNQAGQFYIQGIPPYYGQHPARMLVPSYLKK